MTRLLLGGCLIMIGAFLLLFIGATTKWTGTMLVICVAAIPLILGVYLSHSYFERQSDAKRSREAANKESQQKEILKLAATKKGILTVTEVVGETSVNPTDARMLLDEFVVQGIAIMKTHSSGDLFYEFPDEIPSVDQIPVTLDPAPADPIREKADSIMKLKQEDEIAQEYEQLRKDSSATADEVLLHLLASGTVSHSTRASHTLALKKAGTCLQKMKEIRAALPPVQGLADYRFYVDRDIKILEAIQSGASCHCPCYVGQGGYSSAYSPQRERNEGFVRILDSKFENYEGRYTCECTICGRKWMVLEDPMGYHYPVWQWKELPE